MSKPIPDNTFYWRFFKVEDPEFDQKMRDIQAKQEAAAKQWAGMCRAVGASSIRTWSHTGEFAGFVFDATPDNTVYKQVAGLWVPKKNTTAGKKIWADLKVMPQIVTNMNSVLGDYGLTWDKPMDFQGDEAYYATVTGHFEAGYWFVKVPSRHFCAATLEAAAQIKADVGNAGSTVLENALWQPPAAWVQLKHWEFVREWDELNEQFS